MQNGFFISCNINKEKKAFHEFVKKMNNLNLCKIVYTKFPILNFESQLNYELKKFKENKNFVLLEEYKSIIIIENRTDVLPSKIYSRIIELKVPFTYALRIIPVDVFTTVDSIKIDSYINENKFDGTYKILFEGRLHQKVINEKIFEKIIPLIKSKVQLNNPDYIVSVQAFKNKIGLAIIKNDYKNFNVVNLGK